MIGVAHTRIEGKMRLNRFARGAGRACSGGGRAQTMSGHSTEAAAGAAARGWTDRGEFSPLGEFIGGGRSGEASCGVACCGAQSPAIKGELALIWCGTGVGLVEHCPRNLA